MGPEAGQIRMEKKEASVRMTLILPAVTRRKMEEIKEWFRQAPQIAESKGQQTTRAHRCSWPV